MKKKSDNKIEPAMNFGNMAAKADKTGLILPKLTKNKALDELPDVILKIIHGAEVIEGYEYNPNMIQLRFANATTIINKKDYQVAKEVADYTYKNFIKSRNIISLINNLPWILEMRKFIKNHLKVIYDKEYGEKVRVLFVRADQKGCGYWRMLLPYRKMLKDPESPLYVECTDTALEYDQLLEYDIIIVQRIFSFEHYYVLESLKRAGKKVVYEVDDDVFRVPKTNPAYKIYGRYDVQFGAKQCMNLADMIVTTTPDLAESLGVKEKCFIFPNSLSLSEFFIRGGTQGDSTKLFWSGSNTHNQDWETAIPAIMKILQERDDLSLTLMGNIPDPIKNLVQNDTKIGSKISGINGMMPEAYFNFLKTGLEADIGIIPLSNTMFNKGKSPCKFVEFAAIGLPIIASNTIPYSRVIEDSKNGLLCSNEEEWYTKLNELIDNTELRKNLKMNARKTIGKDFDLDKNYKDFQNMLYELGKETAEKRIKQEKEDN